MLEIKSAEDHVYEALRARILRGLAPGSPLRLAEIADQYGVSTMPVRSVLRRLEAEGLIRQLPRRGAVVAPLELSDLEEIQAVRAALEGYAARLGAERIGDPGLRRMKVLLGRIRAATRRNSLDQYLAIEHDFHDTCYAASGRDRLVKLVESNRRAADRYIRGAFSSTNGIARSIDFQERFMTACDNHDGSAAEAIIREALQWTVASITPQLETLADDLAGRGTSGARAAGHHRLAAVSVGERASTE